MSILNSNTQPQTILTDEQILNSLAAEIKRFSKKSYDSILEIQNKGINLLWRRGRFTPQQIIDALGSDALKIFQMHGILTDAINQIAAIDGISPEIALPTNAFEVVGKQIEVSEDPYVAQ
jgi:hypothetical protein